MGQDSPHLSFRPVGQTGPVRDPAAALVARYDARAATYDQSDMHRGLARVVADFADLRTVHTVLDVATGTGLVLREIARRAPGVLLLGADLSPGMLAVAASSTAGARLVRADAARLPFPAGSVDLVTCVTGLHLFPRPEAVHAEWARVLRPGGRVLTATFGAPSGGSGSQDFPKDHEPFRTPAGVAAAGAPYGFTLLRHREWRHRHDTGEDHLVVCELGLGRGA